jgi:hypothetical protein
VYLDPLLFAVRCIRFICRYTGLHRSSAGLFGELFFDFPWFYFRVVSSMPAQYDLLFRAEIFPILYIADHSVYLLLNHKIVIKTKRPHYKFISFVAHIVGKLIYLLSFINKFYNFYIKLQL